MIVCILAVKNEMRHLPSFLPHVSPFVSGFVALDDGSTDGTGALLAREPRMLDVITNPPSEEWREDDNRKRLVARARALGARWVLALDPDERLELGVLERLERIRSRALASGRVGVTFALREVWDAPDRYRVDGVWGKKEAARFFMLPDPMSFTNYRRLHGPWHPAELQDMKQWLRFAGNLYHLKMVERTAREARRDTYNRLDPERRFQPGLGYDYLTDERGIVLRRITRARRYDERFIPEHLAAVRAPVRPHSRPRALAHRIRELARSFVHRARIAR